MFLLSFVAVLRFFFSRRAGAEETIYSVKRKKILCGKSHKENAPRFQTMMIPVLTRMVKCTGYCAGVLRQEIPQNTDLPGEVELVMALK
jgi:hypothetical protein